MLNEYVLIGVLMMAPLLAYGVWIGLFNLDTSGVMFQMPGSLFLVGLSLFIYGVTIGADEEMKTC